MDYNRLFYMNITYECNNRCIFCISHNTKNRTRHVENPLAIIEAVNKEYQFSKNDLFIVNGGEPTTSQYFSNILDFLLSTDISIIVYTNGRTLSNYYKYTKNTKIRWIVAFYGLQRLHDKYTGQKGSFAETFNSLQFIETQNKTNISIKFLIEDEEQIEQFKELSKLLNDYNEIHISLILNNNLSKRFELSKSVSPLIKELLVTHVVKLSNIPLCCLSHKIENISTQKIGTYYFLDENGNVRKFNYDKNHHWLETCKYCSLHNVCCDNSLKYRALRICNDKISLEEE